MTVQLEGHRDETEKTFRRMEKSDIQHRKRKTQLSANSVTLRLAKASFIGFILEQKTNPSRVAS